MTHTSSDASSLHLPLLPSYLTLSPFRSQFTFFTPTHTSSSSSSSFTPPHVVFSTPTFSTSSSSSSSSSSSFPNESYLFNASSTTTPSSLPPCSSKRTSSSSSSSSPLSSTFLAFLPPEEDLDEPGRVGWPPSSSSSSSSSVGSFPGRKRRVGQGVFPPPWPPQPAPPLYPLPSQWSSEDKCTLLDLHPNGWTVEYIGPGRTDTDAASIRANHSIPCQTGVYYFELEILSKGRDGYIGIGVCGPEVPLNRLPGWDALSWGYHGDDGHKFQCSGTGKPYGPTFTTGDKVGCGVHFPSRSIFYTKNGMMLGMAFTDIHPSSSSSSLLSSHTQEPSTTTTTTTSSSSSSSTHRPPPPSQGQSSMSPGWLFPCVGLRTPGEKVTVNFGHAPFMFDIHRYYQDVQEHCAFDIHRSVPSLPCSETHLLLGLAKYLAFHRYPKTFACLLPFLQTQETTSPSSSTLGATRSSANASATMMDASQEGPTTITKTTQDRRHRGIPSTRGARSSSSSSMTTPHSTHPPPPTSTSSSSMMTTTTTTTTTTTSVPLDRWIPESTSMTQREQIYQAILTHTLHQLPNPLPPTHFPKPWQLEWHVQVFLELLLLHATTATSSTSSSSSSSSSPMLALTYAHRYFMDCLHHPHLPSLLGLLAYPNPLDSPDASYWYSPHRERYLAESMNRVYLATTTTTTNTTWGSSGPPPPPPPPPPHHHSTVLERWYQHTQVVLTALTHLGTVPESALVDLEALCQVENVHEEVERNQAGGECERKRK